MERRAVVVQESRQDRLAGPRAAADLRGGFQQRDLHSSLGQRHRGGKPVRPATHDHRGAHAVIPRSITPSDTSMSF